MTVIHIMGQTNHVAHLDLWEVPCWENVTVLGVAQHTGVNSGPLNGSKQVVFKLRTCDKWDVVEIWAPFVYNLYLKISVR